MGQISVKIYAPPGSLLSNNQQAMAELGKGPHRSGEVARELGRHVNQLAPTRASLIAKGMIFSPGHGDTAFTVPLFDAFMRRIMPPVGQ